MCGLSAVTSISELCRSSAMRSPRGSMPAAQCSRKLSAPSPSSRTLWRKLWMMSGLNTFSSKFPEAPPILIATSLPSTWAQSIAIASDCVGLTLPGMIELPGSFSGIEISPIPQRGPLASQRTSFAILVSDAATVFSAPWPFTRASFAALASQELARPVGEHLIHVHVGLRARARLPHHERKLGVVPSGEHLVGGGGDGFRLVLGKLLQLHVHARAGALDQRERADQLHGHALAGNAEILERALRLRAPQPVGGDADLAEAVVLDAVIGHRQIRKCRAGA